MTIYRGVFLLFTVMGCVLSFGQLIDFTNVILFLCAFVNLLGVYFLLPVIKREMKEYWADYRSGELYELGKLDADKEIALEELAEANQVRDDSGRNRLADPDDDASARVGPPPRAIVADGYTATSPRAGSTRSRPSVRLSARNDASSPGARARRAAPGDR
ncbi:hypothetical protein BJF82_12720 [Kytococcus sp. CUA-901]|nr:hypothetical protein BJF82_12720 [Kytococcus sp. CUA-901]